MKRSAYVIYSASMSGMLGYAVCYDVWCYELGVLLCRLDACSFCVICMHIYVTAFTFCTFPCTRKGM